MGESTKQAVLIMCDTQRRDMLGCYYGDDVRTPNLDRLASEGMLFERAYCCDPVCGPARSAIFTGVYPHTNGIWSNGFALGADIATLGRLLSNEARADEIVSYYDAMLADVAQGLEGLHDAERPTVLVLQYESGGEEIAFDVPPVTYLQTWMVETGGGNPVWLDAAEGGGWTVVNFEQIAAWDADKIFVIAFRDDASELVERLEADPQWQALRAVKEGELYGFAADLYGWDLPDPRWILGQAWLATKIHPDRFPDLDIMQEVYDFFEQMYGMDQAAVDEAIIPQLKGDIP